MTVQPESTKTPYVSPGMPTLKLGKTTSFFEFWPTSLMYIPVVVQWLLLSLYHRSLTLPLLANPKLPLSGMVGVRKSLLLAQALGEANEAILTWFTAERSSDPFTEQIDRLEAKRLSLGIDYPFVCKPDIGCRGVGVKLVHSRDELQQSFQCYPIGAHMMVQRLADYEPEAGIFYTRLPGESTGKVISMALKYMPYVVGDGQRTLQELVANDVRAGELTHLYQARHAQNWNRVIPKDEPYRLIFAASHSRGAIFKDANSAITTELTEKLDSLLQQIPDFHYGRLDIKFKDLASLQNGDDMQIVEINTASSESLHIWDSNTSFFAAIRALLQQYRILFAMGALNRQRGYTPPKLSSLLAAWRLERELTQRYPETD